MHTIHAIILISFVIYTVFLFYNQYVFKNTPQADHTRKNILEFLDSLENLENTERKSESEFYNFTKINQERLSQLRKTCQKLSKFNKNLVIKLEHYAVNQEFSNHYQLKNSNYDKSRFSEAWKFDKSSKNSKNPSWIACLSPKHGTTNWQRSIIAAKENKSSTEIEWDNKLYHRLDNLEKWAENRHRLRPGKRLQSIIDMIVKDSALKDVERKPKKKAFSNKYKTILAKNRLKSKMKLQDIIDTIVKKDSLINKPETSPKNYRMILARHPIEKLYSAWADKFRSNTNYFQNHIKHKYFKYLNNIPTKYQKQAPPGYARSFPDFIRYWLDNVKKDPKNDLNFNVHWKSQDYNCFPCSVKWDFIAKTETSDYDAPEIMKVFYPESSEFSKILKKYDYSMRGPDDLRSKLAASSGIENEKLNGKWLPEEYKQELREHFRWELEMFGYEY